MAFPSLPGILGSRDLHQSSLREPQSQLLLYAWMQLGRLTDNRILDLFRQGLIKGTVTGGQGNEALTASLALLADKRHDVISFSHRGLSGHLVWSGHPCDHLNQYFANAASPTRAREGNIHHGDPATRSLPMISHLGAMVSTVLGATDSQRRLGQPAVGITFYGDGASSTGDIHESLNLAALLSLPILFVIENNRYAYSTPVDEQHLQSTALHTRAAGYGLSSRSIDMADMPTAATQLADALEAVRSSQKPLLVEAHTLRLRGHAAYDTCDYLRAGEADDFARRDPLPRFRAHLASAGHSSALDAIDADLSAFLENCIKHCLALPRPSPEGMENDLFAPPAPPLAWQPTPAQPAQLNAAQALNAALRKILSERPESIVLGQDIGTYGGAFKVTDGLLAAFGRPRVFNTPLAESACTGYALGHALNAHRPIIEYQFADFISEAFTHVTLNAATMYFRSGAAAPLVFRLPCGGGLTFGSFHSQELESTLLSMPGIKALYPSTPQDAFDALLAAYEDNNPVILFEHKALYRRAKSPVSWNPNYRDVWQHRLVRPGTFATLVTYGEMVHLATEALDYIAQEYGHEIELIDLRCLSPLPIEPLRVSLARTHRLIVLHEGRRTHGFGAELISRLTESNFYDLEAAPLRIAALDLPVPFAPELENAYRPTRDKIIEQISNWLG